MANNIYYINPEWIESAKQDLTDEDMREYYYWLIECRLFGRDLNECQDRFIKIALREVLRQADNIQENYENQVKQGKKGGRKPNSNTDSIYQMAKEGKTGKQIALELNMNEKTVYSNSGWQLARKEAKTANNSDFSF